MKRRNSPVRSLLKHFDRGNIGDHRSPVQAGFRTSDTGGPVFRMPIEIELYRGVVPKMERPDLWP